jgi:chromosome segregation ATPase
MDSVNDKMDDYSKQLRTASKDNNVQFTNINEKLSDISVKIALNEHKANNVADTIKGLPERISTNETKINNISEDITAQWTHITGVKDDIRDLNTKIKPTQKQIGSISFWTSPNGTKLLQIILLVTTGLLALAGYQAVL